MNCYYCGKELSASNAFCEKCGKAQGANAEIINSAKNGEEKAITYLYSMTYNSVFQAIRPLIKDEDLALDILQDSYIKAFESLGSLEKPEQFRAWVKRIAQNKSKDWLKKKKPTLFSELRPDDESGEIDFEDEREFSQPNVILDKGETRRLLWEIIDSLSDEQRLVVSMYCFDEMQVKEIALELGLSENTVKSRLNYARKNIESKVLLLEKQGTKLYSLAPIPFLLWLIRSGSEKPSAAALAKISGAVSVSTTATAATAAATGAGASIVTKLVAGIVAAAPLIGGGTAVYRSLQPEDKQPNEIVSPQPIEESSPKPSEEIVEDSIDVLDIDSDPGLSQPDFLRAYEGWDASANTQTDYTGFSFTTARPATYRIDEARDDEIHLTYSVTIVDVQDRVVEQSFVIYGSRTGRFFNMKRIEIGGIDFTARYWDFDFTFLEDSVELTIRLKGAGAEGAPAEGTYILTK